GKRFGRVLIQHRNSGLHNHRSGIEILVHKVYAASGSAHSVFKRLPLCFEAGEGRQKRGVNIQNPVRELLDEVRTEQAHESGETNQISLLAPNHLDQLPVVWLAFEAL